MADGGSQERSPSRGKGSPLSAVLCVAQPRRDLLFFYLLSWRLDAMLIWGEVSHLWHVEYPGSYLSLCFGFLL